MVGQSCRGMFAAEHHANQRGEQIHCGTDAKLTGAACRCNTMVHHQATKKDGPASRIKKDVHGDDIPKRKSPHAIHPKTSHPLQNGVEVGSDIGEHAANITDKQRAVEDSAK